MVENRKLFYAISVLLLSCCQIITMFPHHADSELLLLPPPPSSQSDAGKTRTNTRSHTADTSSSNNSENNRANVDSGSSSHQSYGNNDDDSEFIIAVERKLHDQLQHHHQTMRQPIDGALSQPAGNLGVWEGPDIEVSENVDDLIFLDKRLPINQHQYVAQLPPRLPPPPSSAMEQLHRHHQHLFEIHHHLSADGLDSGSSSTSDEHSDSLTHPTFASSTVASKNVEDVHFHAHHLSDTEAAEAETDADGAWPQPHEIQLQPDNNEEVSGATISTSADAVAPPLDLSDFLALIPATKVKAIVAHYYRNDPEVQRANAFLSSRDFISLKHHIISIPEMSAFLRYLNSSGLDLVHFVTTLTNLTTTVVVPATAATTATTSPTEKGQMTINAGSTAFETNDIEYGQKQSTTATTTAGIGAAAVETRNIEIQTHETPSESAAFSPPMPPPMPTSATESVTASAMASATTDMETTTLKEQLNGLHGLVDSILDVLPQDQILATFFDKLESSEQFSKLVDNIGSPEFSKILNNMQNSVPLRNLIFTLHNNGIYVIRIVDSLKSYFFLGGF